jgi:DNA repair protein RecN (Recombination protein N)
MGPRPRLTMLLHLRIRDLAIIDAVDLSLDPGFTVLTGETGAGKSILIDAIGLLLGDRADATLVRDGAEAAELSAELSLDDCPQAVSWLEEQALQDPDADDRVLLRRVINRDGRSRAFINGRSAPLSSLRELGESLIEIHGQHEHQNLMKAQHQRALLDAYANHSKLLDEVAGAASEWRRLSRAISAAEQRTPSDPAHLAYLRSQAEEIEGLGFSVEELETLADEQRRLANAGELLNGGGQAVDSLYGGDGGAYDVLSHIGARLERLSAIDPSIEDVANLVEQARIQVEEAAQSLRRILERTGLDPERLQAVEDRMGRIHDLARKHRIRPEMLPERLAEMHAELAAADAGSTEIEALHKARAIAFKAYSEAAQKLSQSRKSAAKKLTATVQASLAALGMKDARLPLRVENLPDADPSPNGSDEVCIDFTANPGQAPRPLARVASGGELSRISLAIQVAVSEVASVPVMIFDEVDAGVGGGTAEIVGTLLRQLSGGRQVLCVTHLPQVAAQGVNHYRIQKSSSGKSTRTQVVALEPAARTEELARMLGGVEITDSTRALAHDMLQRAR